LMASAGGGCGWGTQRVEGQPAPEQKVKCRKRYVFVVVQRERRRREQVAADSSRTKPMSDNAVNIGSNGAPGGAAWPGARVAWGAPMTSVCSDFSLSSSLILLKSCCTSWRRFWKVLITSFSEAGSCDATGFCFWISDMVV